MKFPSPYLPGFCLILSFFLNPCPWASAAEPEKPQNMVFIKGECFQMGDVYGEGQNNEIPAHEVCVDDFFMDKYEVSQKKFLATLGFNPSRFTDCESCPVENVTWLDASRYCRKDDGKRLPTEAEWEFAAREGGKKVRFGSGTDVLGPDQANFDGRKQFQEPYSREGEFRKKTVPVESLAANAVGLYGMSGNVWEWVSDWYDRNYWRSSYYETGPKANPDGPFMGRSRVLRGGSWNDVPGKLRASYRYFTAPGDRRDTVGFRCVKPAPPSEKTP